MPGDVLYHYSCDHGAAGIARTGIVVPGHRLIDPRIKAPASGRFCWFTDLGPPAARNALGLTSNTLACDRTAWVFRVANRPPIQWWPQVRRHYPLLHDLERAPGAMPMHWFVSTEPVEILAPVPA